MSRRLFSTQIIDSDAFLDMPSSAQNLYFHLGMRADDDGFIGNPKKIARMCGANEDDLKVLLGKRFVLAFESGVVVIKHWLIHNTIRADRYNETQYLEEKNKLRVKENKSYTDDSSIGQPLGNQMATKRIPKLSKVKLSKVKTNTLFETFWNEYPNKVAKKKTLSSWEVILPNQELFDKIINAVKAHKESERWSKGIIPHPTTWLNQERWNEVLLKEKPVEKKPYYKGDPMVQKHGKWYVIVKGQWLEYAGKQSEIEYK